MKHSFYQAFFSILLAFVSATSMAQYGMSVELAGGNVETFSVSDIRSIKFNDAAMLVNQYNGVVASYAISDIVKYTFAESTALASIKAEPNALHVFPNPAEEQIDVAYTSEQAEEISIELTDAMGRPVLLIYSGIHQGSRTYKQTLELPSGLFFCRLSVEGRTMVKPFLVK
jgi:hypothetical protein